MNHSGLYLCGQIKIHFCWFFLRINFNKQKKKKTTLSCSFIISKWQVHRFATETSKGVITGFHFINYFCQLVGLLYCTLLTVSYFCITLFSALDCDCLAITICDHLHLLRSGRTDKPHFSEVKTKVKVHKHQKLNRSISTLQIQGCKLARRPWSWMKIPAK